jgi:hypothetical protein
LKVVSGKCKNARFRRMRGFAGITSTGKSTGINTNRSSSYKLTLEEVVSTAIHTQARYQLAQIMADAAEREKAEKAEKVAAAKKRVSGA